MIRPATVRVPASTSNLGSGFDTLGLAVGRYLTARFRPGGDELVVRREGTLADLDVGDGDDLLVRAFLAELSRRGVDAGARSGTLVASSEIPLARGLGTSAAAVVGGLLLAAAAAGDDEPDRERLLDEAARLEGHGDNAAPALFGGLVAVAPRPGGGLRALPLPLSPRVGFAWAAPSVAVSTREARRALPSAYPRRTAVEALGRLASLLWGLAEGDAEALAVGFTDELHVPYRLGFVPGGAEALAAAAAAGAWGATVSGAGSGLLAVGPRESAEAVAAAMAGAFRAAGVEVLAAFPLEPDPSGARVDAGDAAPAGAGGRP